MIDGALKITVDRKIDVISCRRLLPVDHLQHLAHIIDIKLFIALFAL